MSFKEKTIDSTTVYSGKILNLRNDKVELANGKIVSREVVEHSGGVGVLAIDDDDNIIMVKQYRYGVSDELLEIPAGKLNYGEDHYECGMREITEETGYIPTKFTYLCKFHPTPAYDTEVIHIYLGENLILSEQNLDEDEVLDVIKMPFEKAVAMALSGEFTDGKTLIAILKFALMRKE